MGHDLSVLAVSRHDADRQDECTLVRTLTLIVASDSPQSTLGGPRSPVLAHISSAVRTPLDESDAEAVQLAQRVAIYEGLGAVFDLRRVQARLRPYGIRSGSRAAHRATTGREGLMVLP